MIQLAEKAYPIRIWLWPDAPEEYRFPQGGKESFVAFIPDYLEVDELPIDKEVFGSGHITEVQVPGGILWIGQDK